MGTHIRKIGLLGGSFNPAHEGHRHISKMALARLGLDQVWWLVSPQNPLKDASQTADYDQRLDQAVAAARHPRIRVSDFEQRHHTSYTIDTLRALQRAHPNHRFVWLMGADNLAGFHHWRNWQQIMRTVPIAVIDRPGNATRALASPAAQQFARYRLNERDWSRIGNTAAPAWAFLSGPLSPLSSTAIRDRGDWP